MKTIPYHQLVATWIKEEEHSWTVFVKQRKQWKALAKVGSQREALAIECNIKQRMMLTSGRRNPAQRGLNEVALF